MAELPRYQVSPQEAAALMSESMVKWWLGALGTMVHVMGSENAMKAYGPVMRGIGKEKMEEMNKQLNITSKDAIALGSVVNLWEDMMGIQGRVEEATPNRVVKVNTVCPLSKAPHEACKALDCAIHGMRDVVSPDFKFTSTHLMTKGDPYCRWVIERK
jgi:predicted ArsR family transcriptional regulator